MASNDTFFTNDTGSASSSVDYVRDAFKDISIPANSNSGLTDNANTNPMGLYFGNSDAPRYGAKTLLIKDIVLIEDRTKWISSKPTYQVIFHENFPEVVAYVFGGVTINQKNDQLVPELLGQNIITLQSIGDGMGVTGVIRRSAWLVSDETSATATAQLSTDGSNTTTIDFSALAPNSDATSVARYSVFAHEAANSTQDLHDRRITALQPNTLKLIGLIVYFENSNQNIDLPPGTTYVDKSKITTTTGATLPLPTYGSSLGGVAAIYKTQSSGYASNAVSATAVISLCQGSSGTNLLTVTTGQGGSFLAGYGLVVPAGASVYVGSVVSVSTDTLTVSPTLPFGVSNVVYTPWKSGSTLGIGASILKLTTQIDFGRYLNATLTPNPFLDPLGKFAFFQSNVGITNANLGTSALGTVPALFFKGASGFFQVDGHFSAAEIEYSGVGILNATLSINGTPGYSVNTGQTGAVKRTVFTDAGPGWNSFLFQPGTSMGASIGISKINLYEWNNQGVTFGVLAQLSTNQAFTDRSAINATLMALGTGRRIYADQMYLKGSWVRALDSTAAGGVKYTGSSTNSILQIQYYGKNFAIIGTVGTSALVTIDGVSTSAVFNTTKTVATEGFHTVTFTHQGGTSIIHAFDFSRSVGGLVNSQIIGASQLFQSISPLSFSNSFISTEVQLYGANGYGSTNINIRRFATMMINQGRGVRYVDSATDGAAFNIDEDGVYSITYIENFTASDNFGISKNSTQLATNISSPITSDTIVAIGETRTTNAVSGVYPQVTLRKGDVIRAHTNNGGAGSGVILFRIVQLRKL